MMCWTSTTDWDWLMPYAQASIGRKEYAEASTILTGMLNNIRSVDERRRKTARSMVGQAFSRMGAVGLEIDADSPIAPLMQISLYLRLGDKELALSSYTRYRELFDENQFKILSLEACKKNLKGSWEGIQDFLHLDRIPLPEAPGEKENATGGKLFRMLYRGTIKPIK